MKRIVLSIVLALGLVVPLAAQETPQAVADGYDSLADAILALRDAEHYFVAAMLDGHLHGAKARMKNGDWEGAAGEMALFANEGDNKIGGIRKRLVEGGHHHNSDDGPDGEYETGYVIVTREAKADLLGLATKMRQAGTDEERKEIWGKFAMIAKELLAD